MADIDPIRECRHCGLRYHWQKSPSSSLKMTYCGSLCERADLGFTIEALLRVEPKQTGLTVVPTAATRREVLEEAA